ncbi:hypothetical protein QJS10_CPB04g01767 [Acorus calamus]|uniref:Uncharacterized protein n=1 Tax=Acorus calamus TaxID=4465 RepID=A0AAV9F2N5_ACOCL|nr:hypothetical protein QJS10_CPB04g01767 [Acorus calamus]
MMMSTSTSSSSMNAGHPSSSSPTGLKTYFKTPEGRYKLQYEKTHPAGLLHFSHGKAVSQVTLAHLKEKATNLPPTPSSSSSSSGGGLSAASGVRSAAARLLGGGNGSRALSFVGGNGANKFAGVAGGGGGRAVAGGGGSGVGGFAAGVGGSPGNFDGKGTYLIFNAGDTLFISDYSSQDKDPIKAIHFGNSNPVCHAFDPDAKDGHDLLIGLNSGDGDGAFVVAHADGNLYVYEKSKDGSGDSSFPIIKDPTQFSVAHARSSKSNPIARWHVCQGSINCIAFSTDGAHLATVGRDGYLRVFDYSKEQLICGVKSYYGALLCCTWSPDGKYILTGGEDDLVQVWSMEDRKVVAWGEGHNSWVSGVAFDSYWSSPSSDGTGESVMYRFGSVGQSAHWDNTCPVGTLQPAPSMRDVPKLSPLVAHRVHTDPLSGLVFTKEAVLTVCREGHVKIWARPGNAPEIQLNTSETAPSLTTKDRPVGKVSSNAGYKQQQAPSSTHT